MVELRLMCVNDKCQDHISYYIVLHIIYLVSVEEVIVVIILCDMILGGHVV